MNVPAGGLERWLGEAVTVVSRLVRTSTAYNAINVPTIIVYVQRFPGRPERDNRGVQGLDYRITCNGVQVRQAQTPATGRVDVRLPVGMNVSLHVLGTEYQVSRLAALHPRTEIRGVQQRLEMLGYHVGGALHGNADLASTYVNPNVDTEHAMLDFQADSNLFPDAMFGSGSLNSLRNLMRNSGGE